jgi:UDP-N-acetylglucosamine--N-acetylmuramyl-(pentapeptide) pyrophosphoryl-undecaprenol N-acetylglucosamine transferase
MRLLIAGGGTGGHLFPALAVARAVRAMDPESHILFVGTRHGIEARIIPGTEFPIRFITARGMRQTGLLNTIRGALEAPLGVMQSLRVIRSFRPTVVLGVGGYASGPTLAAAVLMRVRTAIQEQNSVMGTTNRLLCRFVNRIFTSWEDTEPAPPKEKSLLTGNPIREDLLEEKSPERDHNRFHILVFGGSRGARSINLAMAENLDLLVPQADKISVRHQTGDGVRDQIGDKYRQAGIEAEVTEFITDMGPAYQWADLVVCRSGASSLAEITALGKAALVIPYPYAIGDHQAKNAAVLASRGAVRVIRDQDLKNGALVKEIRTLVEKPDLLKSMAENSRKLGRPFAAREIAAELMKIQRSRS